MSKDAGALHCPNCGGPAAPGDAACRYCHAALATVSCPACFALMFEGAAYCPSCGARRARAAGAPVKAPCPSCRGVMHDVSLGDTSLLECERCRGMWIDAATFEHICASRETQGTVLDQWPFGSAQGTPQPARPAAASGQIHYRKCVACGKMMNRINFGRLSGTVVDVCKGHGTFLDAGELHLIVAFIQKGGLDRARQRQIEELKEEQRRLESAQGVHRHSVGGEVEMSWSLADIRLLLDHITDK
jgi:Zn-finger nucleic acid-binding protein